MKLQAFLNRVFHPQPGETALVLTDVPANHTPDNNAWREWRVMAAHWRDSLARLGTQVGFSTLPLARIPAVSGRLQLQHAMLGDEDIIIDHLLSRCSFAIALTNQKSLDTLELLTRNHPQLRMAAIPQANLALEHRLIHANHTNTAQRCHTMANRLHSANQAVIHFTNGDTLSLDLRYRQPHINHDQIHQGSATRFLTLPGGAVEIACYAGERPNIPSQTHGILPIEWHQEVIRLEIFENQVVEILGRSEAADDLRAKLSRDSTYRHLGGLRIGCNVIERHIGDDFKTQDEVTLLLGQPNPFNQQGANQSLLHIQQPWQHACVYHTERMVGVARIALLDFSGDSMPIYAEGLYLEA